ncbi:MAG: hypothetical protein KC646_02590 [Candidatus Cloacimonetes bacterium]|nr:hypothetical protein [Candidatus Cloacimonadota bacterium]
MSKKFLKPSKTKTTNSIARKTSQSQGFDFAKTIEFIREHTRIRNEVVGVIYVTIALIAIAGLTLDESGYVKQLMNHFTTLNGVGPLFLIAFALFYGIRRIYGITYDVKNTQLLAFPVMYFAFIGFVSSVVSPSLDGRSFGGIVGDYIFWYTKTLLGLYSSRIVLFSAFLISFMHITEIYVSDIINFCIAVCYQTGTKVYNFIKYSLIATKKSCSFLLKKSHFLLYTIMNDLITICDRGFSSFRDSVFQKTLHYEGESWDTDLDHTEAVEKQKSDNVPLPTNDVKEEVAPEASQIEKTITLEAEKTSQSNNNHVESNNVSVMQKLMSNKKTPIIKEVETSQKEDSSEDFHHLSKEEVLANNSKIKKAPEPEKKKEEIVVSKKKTIEKIAPVKVNKKQKTIEAELEEPIQIIPTKLIENKSEAQSIEKSNDVNIEKSESIPEAITESKTGLFSKIKSKIKTIHEEIVVSAPVDSVEIDDDQNENIEVETKQSESPKQQNKIRAIEPVHIEDELEEVVVDPIEVSSDLVEDVVETSPIVEVLEEAEEEDLYDDDIFQPREAIQPSIDFLMDPPEDLVGDSDDDLWDRGSYLIQTLETYKINALLESFVQGPTITRFELKPAPGTKLSKIVGLTDEMKMALEAKSVRVEAPIPGTNKVGIEIPNANPVPVFFKEVAEDITGPGNEDIHPLAIAFGKDIAGNTVISNLAKMPHMLVAGATGSGKSVCVNTLISSILFKASPDQVQFIMIDPKQVELAVYRGIPHLITDVVTDPEEAAAALQWGVDEMERRYTLLSNFGVRHIDSFNEKVLNGTLHPIADVDGIPKVTLPYIVIIVDELADLMMVAKKEVETSICRIAQKARAIGIHLVIATQRPSVDVITGLIKANLPSRIAFMVSSGIDSKTILNQVGAEHLLGKGDCLYFPAGQPKPDRVQGAFMNDDEVAILVETVKSNYGGAQYQDITSQYMEPEEEKQDTKEFNDEKYNLALEVALRENNISTSMLQRHLGIGYNRAARIVDVMFARGVCGSQEGGKKRKVLITESQLAEFKI